MWLETASNANMDVRLIINQDPDEHYQAFVISLEAAAGWSKTYATKTECLTELCLLGVLTLSEEQDLMEIDFDEDRMIVNRATVDPRELVESGYEVITLDRAN
jgi:hypothetical protein